jgi:tRNA dimethylallyltransferase
MARTRIVIITGPTAVGKTAVGVALARLLDTEMISADSMQVYTHLRIATARPTADELQGVACHLTGFVPPDRQYNLGDFVRDADAVIARLTAANKIPVICGGTGLYLRGLVEGVFDGCDRDENIRRWLDERLEREGLAALHSELQRVDPQAAGRIMPNDRQRILRALEVYHATGSPISALQRQSSARPRYDAQTFILLRDRRDLYRRIEQRVDAMIAAGLEDEVRAYLAAGFSPTHPAFHAVGCLEMARYLAGEIPLDEAISTIKRRTRQYAKRQLTWFRSMHAAIEVSMDDRTVMECAQDIAARVRQRG